jgi:hypothetical protein
MQGRDQGVMVGKPDFELIYRKCGYGDMQVRDIIEEQLYLIGEWL